MYRQTREMPVLGILVTGMTCLLCGLWNGNGQLLGLGAIGVSYVLLRIGVVSRHDLLLRQLASRSKAAPAIAAQPAKPRRRALEGESTLESLVEELMSQGRCALLLRPQIAANLTPGQYEPAMEALQQQMAVVPAGTVALTDYWRTDTGDHDEPPFSLVHVDQLFLDRYPVTNEQFYEFVMSGGYEQMALWEPEIWPAILDFVDATGCPGPRFWRNGRYAQGEDRHPVVGVSWYEAAAYARWVGKRLPTDGEWVKAASWPVTLPGGKHQQRKFPWGESMDPGKANLWGASAGRVVAVDQFTEGVSVGGVYGLIGNVWEWTAGSFQADAELHDEQADGLGMKNIRGGAFDTYFDNQAAASFASGENPLARKHNIGFRCALSACDLAPAAGTPVEEPADSEQQFASLEEVAV